MKPKSHLQKRLAFVRVLVVLALALVPLRLRQLAQSAQPDLADSRRHVSQYARWLPEMRGGVTDRNGRVLAETREEDGKPVRSYPGGESMANLVGFATHTTGQSGLESYLTGFGVPDENRRSLSSRLLGDEVFTLGETPATKLTIDVELQKSIYALFEARKQPGCAVLMTKEGELLAAVSYPSFDPNRLMDKDDSEYRRFVNTRAADLQWNRCLLPISIGSTIKPFIWAIYRKEFGVWPDAGVYCPGWIRLRGQLIHCHKRHGLLTTWQAGIEKSCNIASIKAVDAISPYVLADWFHRLGLADTPVEGLSTRPGKMQLPFQKPETKLQVGLGSTVAFSPLALCRAYTAIFNDGKLPTVRIISEINGRAGTPNRDEQVLPPEICAEMKRALRGVVRRGTATNIRSSRLMGKTGTAKSAVQGTNIGNTGIFAWAAPYPDPSVVGVIVFEGQKQEGFHGSDAAIVARQTWSLYKANAIAYSRNRN